MTKRATVELTETEVFLKLDGVVIAKRGQPDSDQAGTWIALEPGYEITGGLDDILVHHYGARVN